MSISNSRPPAWILIGHGKVEMALGPLLCRVITCRSVDLPGFSLSRTGSYCHGSSICLQGGHRSFANGSARQLDCIQSETNNNPIKARRPATRREPNALRLINFEFPVIFVEVLAIPGVRTFLSRGSDNLDATGPRSSNMLFSLRWRLADSFRNQVETGETDHHDILFKIKKNIVEAIVFHTSRKGNHQQPFGNGY